ncbi:MAG: DUF5117 domain-containing protein, partial [Bacteroidota bacterium]|nr:DUF5117 domain-containing protein [Bacteroidota bacterium]
MKTSRQLWHLLSGLLLFAFLSLNLAAQDTVKTEKTPKAKPKFKTFAELIPDTAFTKTGVFITHEFDNKLYYEIPLMQLGKEFLWIVQFSKTQTSFGYGGTEVIRRVVRWERFQDQILLRNVEYQMRADEGTPEDIAVKASSVENIIKAIKIEAFGADSSVLINVTSLFTGDIHEFSPKKGLKASSIDKSRSFISSIKAFEQNLETRVLATYKLKPASSAPTAAGGRP